MDTLTPAVGSNADEPGRSDRLAASRAVSAASGNLFGRGLLYVVVWSLGLIGGVVVIPLVTRVVGVTGFGQLAAALAVGQVLVALVGLGMQAAIIRQYVDDDGDRRARGLLFVALVLALLLTGLVEVTGPLWCRALGFSSFGGTLQLIVLWVFPAAGCQAAMGLLRAQDRLGPFSMVSILQSVGTQACGIALLLFAGRSASDYTRGLLVGQVVAFAVAVIVTRPRPAGISDVATVRAALAFGLPLVPQGLAVFVLSAGDRVVVQRLLGPTAVGRYQVGYSVGSIILLLMATLNQSWEASVLAISDETMRAEVLAHSRDQLLRTIQPLLIAIVVGAPIALRIFAPPAFRPNDLVVVTAVVALSATPYAFYAANVLKLFSVRRTRPLAAASMICAVGNILLNFMLIPVLGITGSAVATLLAFAMQAAITQWASRRFMASRSPSLGTWGFVFMGSALTMATVLLPKTGIWTEIRIAIALVCIGWLMAMLRATTAANRRTTARTTRRGGGPASPLGSRQAVAS